LGLWQNPESFFLSILLPYIGPIRGSEGRFGLFSTIFLPLKQQFIPLLLLNALLLLNVYSNLICVLENQKQITINFNKMKSFNKSIVLSISFLSIVTLTCRAQDWPQWRGVNRDGKVTGFAAPQTWPQQLSQTWKITVGFGDATPALVNNKLYVFTRQGNDEILQCIDASSGKQLWQSAAYPTIDVTGPPSTHPGPRSSVAVAEGNIVTLGVAGDIACFDASSGKLQWRNEDYKGAVPQFFTGMSPLINSGICYAHLGGPDTGHFMAFDLSTGAIKWKVDGEGPAYGSPVLMTVDNAKQIVFQAQSKLISFNLSDGKQLWEYPTPVGTGRVQNATSPVVDQNIVYFTGLNNGFNAIEIKKEGDKFVVNKLWTNPDFSTGYSTPLLKDGFLYGLSNRNRLFCINANTGQTAWADETVLQNFGSIVDAGLVIIVLTSNSNFVVLKPDGQKYNQVTLIKLSETGIYAHPVVSGKRIFIKDNETLTLFTIN
jgi:outer membrane protein assembly factor BamB